MWPGCTIRTMPVERSLPDVLRNLLKYGHLSFRDFVEVSLYHPEHGYYAGTRNPVGKDGDFITAQRLSPAFGFAIARLVREFVSRSEGAVCSFVDVGCGDGEFIRSLAAQLQGSGVRFFGIDRALDRANVGDPQGVTFLRTIDEVPRDGRHIIFSNELYDALPFARLVQRGEDLHELWVAESEGGLDWSEQEAPAPYVHYFEERGIRLAEGQFADISLEWGAFHTDLVNRFAHALIIAIDYGYPQKKLFDPRVRRFGTAAAYSGHRVSRDLLANPGGQDLTAHINFSDLERAGDRAGATTLFFDILAKFLLTLGITDHPLFSSVLDLKIDSTEDGLRLLEERDEARRLVLPDGIGADLRVMVQVKALPDTGWLFQRALFGGVGHHINGVSGVP